MGHKWIIDVLDDLTAFARQNDLQALAEKLEDTTQVALTEISDRAEGTPSVAYGNGTRSRRLSGQSGAC